ncbi:DAO-domain-containing protein [Peniophora sp. CONT]|nr:DAO-domain-containing protein [Peniophora sp. CONT]
MLGRARVLVSPKALGVYAAAATTVAGGGYLWLNSGPSYPPTNKVHRSPPAPWTPPTREDHLKRLRDSRDEEFDILIIGGGATGSGVAVDAATRGLKTALVERDDFSSGTSSKSTKLVHGGVRYLQKAIMELDYEQYKLVTEALHERLIFLHTAPYLSHMLPIMLPIYKYWQVPYFWVGCKMYDLLAGKENMETSYLMTRGKTLETFPMLKSEGLVGSLVYYDGQHNDARMNMALIMTAVKHGATVANKIEVLKLNKDASGKLVGATVRDNMTGDEWDVKAKGIINATGPFADAVLTMDNPSHKPIVQPSSGVHITLPDYYSPRKMGMLDPATSDGRVIFFLPWEGGTIAGTTDAPAPVEQDPKPMEEEIRWILNEVRNYLSPDIKVRRADVLSAWSGLRPLVRNPNADPNSTQGLVRNHLIYLSDSGLLTITGGKWTTYREMAAQTVDEAVKAFKLKPTNECITEKVQLIGSEGWSRNMFVSLIQRYGLEPEVAQHLSHNYGDRAWTVLDMERPADSTFAVRVDPNYPFLESEVRYAVRHEYALTATDVVARRMRLAFLNAQAALNALPRVVDIMAAELGWDEKTKEKEYNRASTYLGTMGLQNVRGDDEHVAASLDALKSAFKSKASVIGGEERVPQSEILALVSALKEFKGIGAKDVKYVLEELGYKSAKTLNYDDVSEVYTELKEVALIPSPAQVKLNVRIPVEKSGGGV